MESWQGAEALSEHLRPIEGLKPHPANVRRGDVGQIAESLKRFGQVRAVLVTDDDMIVAGHHVVKAAKTLGWTHVAAIPAEFATREDTRDYLIADNQLSELGYIEPEDQLTLLEEVERRGSWEGTGFTPEDLDDMRALSRHKTEMMRIEELQQHDYNYREHPDDQVEHLMQSLREHGLYRNIVIANDGTVLAGHGILEAARRIGLKKLPVTRLPIAPDDPEALKVLAGDNELGKLGELDDRELSELLKKIRDDGDVEALMGTGFDAQTLANLVLVTRPKTEISSHDAAAEWVGLPEWESAGPRIRLTLDFDNGEDRDKLVEQLELKRVFHRNEWAWSSWWPPRDEFEDLHSLRFDYADVGGGQFPVRPTDEAGTPVESTADVSAESSAEEQRPEANPAVQRQSEAGIEPAADVSGEE